MKRKLLLTVAITLVIASLHAQKRTKKNEKETTAYAITSTEKGQNSWTEVRLVNLTTGEEQQTIYQSSQETELLNARTGKPIVKKDLSLNMKPVKTIINLDMELNKKEIENNLQPARKTIMVNSMAKTVQSDKPFATNSAACAYDKKHERLYYTPMRINQLRYIDLKSKTPRIYYFEDETLGNFSNPGNTANQITRMVMGSDGNGYALTNSADHLVRFTTDKKATITDLGTLTDDPANGSFTVHNPNGYGGDLIADASGGLYLITANRIVFKIDIANRLATYKGSIQGLPRGYTTNGAIVESGSSVIVNSANSTQGYYKFDLNTFQSEKLSTAESVFNASDLANGSLAFEKKKKNRDREEILQPEVVAETPTEKPSSPSQDEFVAQNKIAIYPNPVTNGFFKLSFEDQSPGKYQVQLIDISGKLISSQAVTIANKMQVEEFKLPELTLRGNYLVKVVDGSNKALSINKIVVQ